MDTPQTLAAALLAAGGKAVVGASAVVAKGALNVKTEAKANVLKSAPVHNGGAHNTITYDAPHLVGTRIESEIGYDRGAGRAAALGNLLEYGGGGDRSPAHRDLGRALDAEEPRFEQAIATMAMRPL